MNGWRAFCISLALFGIAIGADWLPGTDTLGRLLSTATIFAFGFSLFLYFFGKRRAPAKKFLQRLLSRHRAQSTHRNV